MATSASVLVQTDYRESDTQTDPYSPPYFVSGDPELPPAELALIEFTWKNGLPATLEDIVVIKRALTRRLLKNVNRAEESEEEFLQRIRLMEDLERQQWADREKDLEKVKNQKMEIIEKLLHQLDSKLIIKNSGKIDRLYCRLRSKHEHLMGSIANGYQREMRKLHQKYHGAKKTFKRNVIKDYVTITSSDVSVCPTTDYYSSFNHDVPHKVPDFQLFDHHHLQSLQMLTNTKEFKKNLLEFDCAQFVENVNKLRPQLKARRLETKLEEAFIEFRAQTIIKPKETERDVEDFKEMMKNVAETLRPEDLTDYEDTKAAAQEHAAITIQKLFRGRAEYQNVWKQINKDKDIILDLKAICDATSSNDGMLESAVQGREEKDELMTGIATTGEIVEQLEGETLGRMLDFLDKEMIRLLDERKVHSLMLLSERGRRGGDAAEAGRRQREEEERMAKDEIFKRVIGVNQKTVDMYLEDIYLDSINRAANDEARKYVQGLATVLNETANAIQTSKLSEYESDELSAELLSTFIIPEIQRHFYQNQETRQEKMYYRTCGNVVNDMSFGTDDVQAHDDDPVTNDVDTHTNATEDVNATYTIKEQVMDNEAEQVENVDDDTANVESP